MKKIVRIMSLTLVFAMVVLCCVSCGSTPEERLAEAIAKLADAEKVDYSATVNMFISANGTEMSVPMQITAKADVTDKSNPIAYTNMSMSMAGESMDMKMFYIDGYVYYAATSQGVTQKYKVAMSYDEMMEDEGGLDLVSLIEAKKDDLTNGVEITENYDRTLTVKMIFAKADFADELEDIVGDLSESLGFGGSIEVSDTVVEITVDADNNITSVKTSMNIDMNFMGNTASAKYDMEFTYNEVNDSFTIELPTDLDKYVSGPNFN